MEQKDLWQAFVQTGRVEDYLRYRGVSMTESRGGDTVGEQKKTFDDRRSDRSGL